MTAKSLTIRLPVDLYEEGREIAEKHQISLNALIQQCLKASIDAEIDKKLYDAFSLVAENREEASVEFAMPAQWEVIHDEH